MGKGERFAVGTLEECFASLERARARYAAADGKAARSFARVLGSIAEHAVSLGEHDVERLQKYMEALSTAQGFRSGIDALPALAITRARAHRAGTGSATVLARAEGLSFSPVIYRLADASAPAEPLDEASQREQMRAGVCAHVRFNHSGRFEVEMRLSSTLDVDLPALYAMSAAHAVHVPSGRLLLQGGATAPDATIDLPAGWYDVVVCTFESQRRVLVLLATTERRSNDAPLVDLLSVRGLDSKL